MLQVLLRVAVWLIVIGLGYLLIGPKLFDSSGTDSPFETGTPVYLPAPKSDRETAYDRLLAQRALTAEEEAEYRRLVEERRARFWQREGVSVEEALSDVKTQRRAHLAGLLQERGIAPEEAAVFFMVVDRDHPGLLDDRE